jgi:hypothetical protein
MNQALISDYCRAVSTVFQAPRELESDSDKQNATLSASMIPGIVRAF